MGKYIRLVQVDFDIMENRADSAITETEIGIFKESGDISAHGKIQKWFEDLVSVKLYLAWDGEVYPKYRTEQGWLR